MGRGLRVQTEDEIQFITTRCLQQRFLLTPSPLINARILGWLGRAMLRHPGVKIYALIVLNNHLHLLASSADLDLHTFLGYWLGNTAKEVNRIRDGRRGPLFERRYSASAVLDDESAQNKLVYTLLNGVKEGLVDSPKAWPGVSSFHAQTTGTQMVGYLPDRGALRQRRRHGERGLTEDDVVVEYPITLSPLPQHADKCLDDQQQTIRDLVESGMDGLRAQGLIETPALGADKVCAQGSEQRPANPSFSTQPVCHSQCDAAERAYRKTRLAISRAYARAMDRYRKGKRPDFPPGTCPPGWMKAIRPPRRTPTIGIA